MLYELVVAMLLTVVITSNFLNCTVNNMVKVKSNYITWQYNKNKEVEELLD